jgi:hypothetical protein
MSDDLHIKNVEIAYLKGEINVVSMKVWSDFGEGNHTIEFRLSTTGRKPYKIKRTNHTHPWGKKLVHDIDRYATDAHQARELAWERLENLRLDDPEEWHE